MEMFKGLGKAGLLVVALLLFVGLLALASVSPMAASIGSFMLIGLGTVYTESARPSDVLFYEADRNASREAVTVLSGQNLLLGTVLGKISKSCPTTGTADGGNTGNGTCTGVTVSARAKIGTLVLKILKASDEKGSTATPAAIAGNTGDGTLASATVGANALPGVYKAICIEPATNAGKFQVEDPNGVIIGVATVAVAFSTGGHLTFTIADGATDFASGDGFTITVSASGAGGEIEVTDPDGNKLPSAKIGTAYTSEQVNFTVNDGSTDFIVGDKFTIAIVAGSGKVKILTPAAVDGTQNAYGIIIGAVDASGGDLAGVAVVRDAVLKDAGMVWPGGITAGQKTTALAELDARHVTVRTAQ
ncbi:MAG: head decoration protein [Thermodesulfovibrionales bacterium]|nr:head decoration protein [Thermodesulfovibrionales bacterium]